MIDVYYCRDCETQSVGYAQLYHPNEEEGGFCPNCYSNVIELVEEQEDE